MNTYEIVIEYKGMSKLIKVQASDKEAAKNKCFIKLSHSITDLNNVAIQSVMEVKA